MLREKGEGSLGYLSKMEAVSNGGSKMWSDVEYVL